MFVVRGYKTELDLNNAQRTACLKHAGCARFSYNWGLARSQEVYRTTGKRPTAIDLHKELNQLKQSDYPWMYEVSKCAPQEALRDLDKAYKHFYRHLKLKGQGKLRGKLGFPKFKKRSCGIGSFRLTGSIKVFGGVVQLPRLGRLRLHEHGYLPTDAKVLSATVSEQAGRWYVSVQVEQEPSDPRLALRSPEREALAADAALVNGIQSVDECVAREFPAGIRSQEQSFCHATSAIGIDLGIKVLATLSDGTTFENPRPLKHAQKKLRRLEKQKSRRKKGSKNREKTRKIIARTHARVANTRLDASHKLTSYLCKNHALIAIEDLHVVGMLKNHCLAGAVADSNFGEIRRQLEYKAEWNGVHLITIDRFYPSSKTCSGCKYVKPELDLSERVFICEECGLFIDRDLNAAINLRRVAVSSIDTQNACGVGSAGDLATGRETCHDEAGTNPHVGVS